MSGRNARMQHPIPSRNIEAARFASEAGHLTTSALKKLAETFGHDLVASFLEEFGGREIYVPLKPTAEHKFALLCSFEFLEALCTLAGGQKILVSKTMGGDGRRERAIALLREGKSIDFVAQVSGLHVRQVSRLRKELLEKRVRLLLKDGKSLEWTANFLGAKLNQVIPVAEAMGMHDAVKALGKGGVR